MIEPKQVMRKPKQLIPKLFLTGASVLASVLVARADYPTTVLSQNPVGYWRLNETTPVVALSTIATNLGSLGAAQHAAYQGDLSGRGSSGALAGDTAASFDGASQYVVSPYAASLAPTNFTIEGWFAPVAYGGGTPCLAACGNFGANRTGWLIYQTAANTFDFRLYINSGASTYSTICTNPTAFVPGTFYHYVAIREYTTSGSSPSNGTIRVYINGVQRGGRASTASYVAPSIAGDFTVGCRSDTGFLWPGKADEVAYYNYALTPSKVAAHFDAASTNAAGYSAQILADSPILYYRFNEPGLPITVNSGSLGTSVNGKMITPATSAVAGPSSPALPGFSGANVGVSLSGSSGSKGSGGYVNIPALNLNTNGVTITGWVKPNGPQAGSAGLVMFRNKTAAPNTGTSAGLTFDQAGGLNLGYNWDGDDATYSYGSGQALADGEWSFASLIVTPGQAIIYAPALNANPSTNLHAHAVLPFACSTWIGADLGKSGFNGGIDEVAVFQRALSVGEVYSQYADAVGSVSPRIFAETQLPAGTLYAGDSLTLSIDAGGSSPLSFQWRKNGLPIGGANSRTYTLTLAAGGPDNYDVVITNSAGNVTSAGVAFSVSPVTAPIITQDITITSRTIYPGGAINLQVKATGGSVGYVWQCYGTNIPNQTNATLAINNVTNINAGPYKCVVTNSAGSMDSSVANITIASPLLGSYDAVVAADAPLCWWRMDDLPASPWMRDSMGRADGAWTNTVTLGVSGALANNGNKAANFDAVNQAFGEVGVLPPPAANGDFTFECWVRPTDSLATESVPFSSFRPKYGFYFQKNADGTWRGRDGYGDLDGGSSRQALIGNVTNGWTHLVAMYSGATGHRTYINGRWDGNSYVDFCRNLNTPMRVGALDPLNQSGLAKWFTGDIDEVAVYGKALSDAQVLSHYLVGLYSSNNPPTFAKQPQSQTVPIGATATFTPLIEGSPTIGQLWYRNGQPIILSVVTNTANTNPPVTPAYITNYATAATLSIANATYADAIGKTYYCVATNSSGTTTSSVVTLTVTPQPAYVNLTNNLVLHLKFDGDLNDSSGKGHHGTAVGSPTIVAGRVGSGALKYTTEVDTPPHGTTVTAANYVTLGAFAAGSDLSFSNNINFSVSYWFKTTTNTTTGDLPILGSANNSYGNAGITFAPSYNGGGWSWSLGDGATYAGVYGAAGSVNNGLWHHLVHTFNRAAGQGLTYLDGNLVSTVGISVLDNIDSGNVFNIGQDPSGGYPEAATNYVDDLSVWKGRILTASEAYSAYYVGNTYGRSFDAVYPITLSITSVDGNNYLVWQAGTLQWADDVSGPYTAVPSATAPYYQLSPTAAKKFFRVAQ